MSVYAQWTLAQARTIVRRELMDPSARWWTDTELNQYITDWQNELQQDYELVWGSSTLTTALNTLTLSSITPAMHRIDAVYFIGTGGGRGYRLAGRLLQDLEVCYTDWRDATADTPREVIQYDSTQIIVWPPLVTTSTFTFEYPRALSFAGDASTVSLPSWTQWSLKPYVAHRAYLRPGPVNDLRKALRYRAQYERQKQRIKSLWDNWLPERYRLLKPAGPYEWDILTPPPASATNAPGAIPDMFKSYIPIGAVDGINTIYTLPILPTALKVFENGLLLTPTVDFTTSGATLTLTTPPQPGDTLVVWTFLQGV